MYFQLHFQLTYSLDKFREMQLPGASTRFIPHQQIISIRRIALLVLLLHYLVHPGCCCSTQALDALYMRVLWLQINLCIWKPQKSDSLPAFTEWTFRIVISDILWYLLLFLIVFSRLSGGKWIAQNRMKNFFNSPYTRKVLVCHIGDASEHRMQGVLCVDPIDCVVSMKKKSCSHHP